MLKRTFATPLIFMTISLFMVSLIYAPSVLSAHALLVAIGNPNCKSTSDIFHVTCCQTYKVTDAQGFNTGKTETWCNDCFHNVCGDNYQVAKGDQQEPSCDQIRSGTCDHSLQDQVRSRHHGNTVDPGKSSGNGQSVSQSGGTGTGGGGSTSGGSTNPASQGIGQSQSSQGDDNSNGNGITKPPVDLPKTKSH